MICKYCLTKIDNDSVFCESCGSRVKEIGNNDETQLIPKVDDLQEVLEDGPDDTLVQEDIKDEGDELERSKDNLVQEALFCMACGRKLPDGAAFCDICGTPTGAVAPVEIRRRKNSIALPILKNYFVKPAETIEKAASEDAALLGASILIIKDILTAVISALCMSSLIEGIIDSWILSGDAFGFAAKVFLLAMLADVILVALLFGIGIVFKAAGSIMEIIGACGVSYLLPSIIWLLALALKGFIPEISLGISLIGLVISALFLGKAIEAVGKIKKDKSMYMVVVILTVYVTLIYGGLIWIIG